ncbi:transglutaminase-like domain-containing protein [Novosphingobium album (ex Hu et al. 2023)]|uniref:Transglutaminase family protein n=1 Tax=Novosphingobium album (ex Hu et al. 2023) TaxID=2930093 RepID=A0ABT0B229_9SPHN|nr:transglutaminase family protein [Novosphingobium album (ex Hu et al. 2023)]MCJ2179075.1 transglutaminase family protein [Novosphingobium album (ex Hu et al. 2023)]
MPISIETRLEYAVSGPVDVLLQIEAAIIPEQSVLHAHIDLPPSEHFARVQGQSGIGDRIWLRVSEPLSVHYRATVEVNRLLADVGTLAATPPHMLPGETVDYLMASRYCPADTFQDFVNGEFAGTAGGARIAAIRDWIGQTLSYEPGSSDAMTTAADTFRSQTGVCRDYAHLMIALARASAVPARFASVYGLGVEPQDFHAVAEVFLDGVWHMVDATGMSAPESIAKIGVGRDAADVAFLTSYGEVELLEQSVSVAAVDSV